jgi:phosphoglycolate phosphatase-like HAD superfamily hydrolase
MALIKDTKVIYNLLESKELIVFDFDGVLANSVEVKTDAFAEIYKPFGENIAAKVVDHHRRNGGMSRFDKFKHYHSNYLNLQLTDHQLLILSEHFSDLVVNAVIDSHEVLGANNFLQHLCLSNKKCIINSATPQKEIYQIIDKRGMTKYFNDIYGSPSSKHENLILAMSKSDVSYKDVVFFGDSKSDLQAASALKIDFVGVGKIMHDLLIDLDDQYHYINNFLNLLDESID